jgi:exodeoxyribonuclease VII small subunit
MMASTPENPTFEQSLAELDRIVKELEDGQIGLEDSLACYEKGVGLIKQCYAQLRQAEQRILLLTGTDGDNQPVLEIFKHVATAEIGKVDVKRRPKKPDEPELPMGN